MADATAPMPNDDERIIRVFVSSTFRDMQEDRDYLVKIVFPQLRKLYESRGVTWGEVTCGGALPTKTPSKALALFAKQEQLCIGLGDKRGVACSWLNRAGVLAPKLYRHNEALTLAEKACELASRTRHRQIANHAETLISRIKKLAQRRSCQTESGFPLQFGSKTMSFLKRLVERITGRRSSSELITFKNPSGTVIELETLSEDDEYTLVCPKCGYQVEIYKGNTPRQWTCMGCQHRWTE